MNDQEGTCPKCGARTVITGGKLMEQIDKTVYQFFDAQCAACGWAYFIEYVWLEGAKEPEVYIVQPFPGLDKM